MIDILEWKDSGEFGKQDYRDWYTNPSDGLKQTRAGWVKNAGKLTFLTIEGAGHLVSLFLVTLVISSLNYCHPLGADGQARRVTRNVENLVE
jgi:hypothetical protein